MCRERCARCFLVLLQRARASTPALIGAPAPRSPTHPPPTPRGRLMNPVALAENSPLCARSADGEPVLPSGTPWRRQLLMLCFTTKVLNEANALLKPGEGRAQQQQRAANPYGGMKVPPLGWLLSRLVDFKCERGRGLGGLGGGGGRTHGAGAGGRPLCLPLLLVAARRHLAPRLPSPPHPSPLCPCMQPRASPPRMSATSCMRTRSAACRSMSSPCRWDEGAHAGGARRRRASLNVGRGAALRASPTPPLTPLTPRPTPPPRQLRKRRMYLKQRQEEARAADGEGNVPILAPEPQLAPSFDADVNTHRYRVLEDPTGIIARWVGWRGWVG